jgi:hypothetical protein
MTCSRNNLTTYSDHVKEIQPYLHRFPADMVPIHISVGQANVVLLCSATADTPIITRGSTIKLSDPSLSSTFGKYTPYRAAFSWIKVKLGLPTA